MAHFSLLDFQFTKPILDALKRQAVGAGHTVKPDESIFFINYGKELARALEKGIRSPTQNFQLNPTLIQLGFINIWV